MISNAAGTYSSMVFVILMIGVCNDNFHNSFGFINFDLSVLALVFISSKQIGRHSNVGCLC